MEELMNLGDSYLENEDYEEAIRCYLKCLEINDNSFLKLKLCYLYILTEDYEMAFYYFINCYQVDPDYINIDYNLGIFLFSMLINLPDEYLDAVLNMELEDVLVLENDLGYKNIKKENYIRSLIINQNFILAKDIIEKKIDFTNSIYNLIIKELINNIVVFQRETYEYQLKLVKDKDYQELIDNLESSASKRQLSVKKLYILKLVKELVEIKDTFDVPIKVNFKTNSLYEAIDCKNYHLALELSKAYCRKNFLDRNSNIIFLLLNEIVKEINAIEEVNQGSDILDMDLGDIMEFDDMNFEIGEVDADEVISNIINYFNNNDLAMVYKEIDDFLISINKLEYRFFLIDIIKLIEDNDFNLLKKVFKELEEGIFKFRVGDYINNFYISLETREYRKCRIYLDIIRNAWKLGMEFKISDNLERVLNMYDKEDDSNDLTFKLRV